MSELSSLPYRLKVRWLAIILVVAVVQESGNMGARWLSLPRPECCSRTRVELLRMPVATYLLSLVGQKLLGADLAVTLTSYVCWYLPCQLTQFNFIQFT